MAGNKTTRFRRAYTFLCGRQDSGTLFSPEELAAASGWQVSSARTNLGKKLEELVERAGKNQYRAHSIRQYTEDEFVRLMSQRQAIAADPRRPELPRNVEALVRKARESALLALQIYNNPTTSFKTEAFAVLMVLAWTALFHAKFERDGTFYFYTESDGSPRLVEGDRKAWELAECMREHWGEEDGPVRRNLMFFVRLRNKVEHRYVPRIDPIVAGECQALLSNFDEMLVKEFGGYFALRDSLAVPLQTGNLRLDAQAGTLRKLQAGHFEEVKGFVDEYRAGLTNEMLADPRYCFRVYLIPKTASHASSCDLAFEFVRPDPEHPEQYAELESRVALIRDRQVRVANAGLLSPKQVVEQVAAKLTTRFTMHHHTLAWKRYGVRPDGPPGKNVVCKSEYCVPDPRHNDYSYTAKWVELLHEKLSDPNEYAALLGKPDLGDHGYIQVEGVDAHSA